MSAKPVLIFLGFLSILLLFRMCSHVSSIEKAVVIETQWETKISLVETEEWVTEELVDVVTCETVRDEFGQDLVDENGFPINLCYEETVWETYDHTREYILAEAALDGSNSSAIFPPEYSLPKNYSHDFYYEEYGYLEYGYVYSYHNEAEFSGIITFSVEEKDNTNKRYWDIKSFNSFYRGQECIWHKNYLGFTLREDCGRSTGR